jgi:hypothetical protein
MVEDKAHLDVVHNVQDQLEDLRAWSVACFLDSFPRVFPSHLGSMPLHKVSGEESRILCRGSKTPFPYGDALRTRIIPTHPKKQLPSTLSFWTRHSNRGQTYSNTFEEAASHQNSKKRTRIEFPARGLNPDHASESRIY